MALSITQTAALGDIIKPGMRVASMGYPDIIAPIDMIEDILGNAFEIKYRSDSEVICKRHGLPQRRIPDAESYFTLLGCKLDVYDVVQERGCEILCDLNKRLDPALKAFNYDIVLDVGTAEHVFNIGQAMKNMASMVKLGGYIIHENPFCMGNHGFYGLNPTFFADFYAVNGFELLECKLVNRQGDAYSVPPTKRFRAVGEEMNVFAMARRVVIQTFVWPVQSKYAGLIPAAKGFGRTRRQRKGEGDLANG